MAKNWGDSGARCSWTKGKHLVGQQQHAPLTRDMCVPKHSSADLQLSAHNR